MFMVARRKGQRIVIGNEIEVVVTELSRSVVRLGITAPASMQILRGEIRDSIVEANRGAAASDSVDVGELESAVATQKQGTDGPAKARVGALSLHAKPQAVLQPCSPASPAATEPTSSGNGDRSQTSCDSAELVAVSSDA